MPQLCKPITLLILLIYMIYSGCVNVSFKDKPDKNPTIKTISSMAEIKTYLSGADLVIFDIDHTILEAKNYYCHSNWFYDLYEEAMEQGISEQRALSVLLPPWEASQKNCEVKVVEPLIPELIKQIQNSKKRVMALTSRSKNVSRETIAQLASLGIDFSLSAPAFKDLSFHMGQEVLSQNGVVFTSDFLKKGDVLNEYLRRTNFKAHTIVFVDDSMGNLLSVAIALTKEGKEIRALFYPRVVRTMPEWNKAQAKLEWEKRHGKIKF